MLQKVILVYGLIIHHNTLAALSQCLYTAVHEDVQCSHSVPQGWVMEMCSDRQVVTGQVVATATGSRVQGMAKWVEK